MNEVSAIKNIEVTTTTIQLNYQEVIKFKIMVTVLLNVVIMFVVNWSIVAIAVYVDSKWISMNLQIFLAL